MYSAQKWYNQDTNRAKWAVLCSITNCWYFPNTRSHRAAVQLANRMNKEQVRQLSKLANIRANHCQHSILRTMTMYQMNLTAIQAATVVASGAKTLSHAIVSALNTSDSIVPSQPPMGTLYSLNDGTHCVAAYNTSCEFGFYVVAPELLATFIEADDNRRKLEHLQLKFPMLELFLKGSMLCVSSGCGDHIEIESITGERFSTAVDELRAYQKRIERANCVYHHDPDNLTFAAIIEFSFGKVNVLEIEMQPLLPKVYSLLTHVKIANVGWVRLEAGDINIVWEIFRTVVMQQWEWRQ